MGLEKKFSTAEASSWRTSICAIKQSTQRKKSWKQSSGMMSIDVHMIRASAGLHPNVVSSSEGCVVLYSVVDAEPSYNLIPLSTMTRTACPIMLLHASKAERIVAD